MFGISRNKRERFIDAYSFSDALQDRFGHEHPELDSADRALVFDGLRHWFQVCRRATGTFVAMPSMAVDDAWHEFILFTRDYERFCKAALGRFLHHTPTARLSGENLADTMRDGYTRAWQFACLVDGVDPDAPDRLPLLFAIDERVGADPGFRYNLAEIAAERTEARRRSGRRVAAVQGVNAQRAWWPLGDAGGAYVLIAGDVDAPGGSGCGGTTGCGGGGCGGG